MLNQCWFNVGPASWTWTDVKPTLIQRLVSAGNSPSALGRRFSLIGIAFHGGRKYPSLSLVNVAIN